MKLYQALTDRHFIDNIINGDWTTVKSWLEVMTNEQIIELRFKINLLTLLINNVLEKRIEKGDKL